MSGRCKDCKHWKSFERWWEEDGQWKYDSLADIDECGDESMKRRYGTCLLAESNGEKPDVEHTKAFAVDGEHYMASLQTAADFGCVQFEAKP